MARSIVAVLAGVALAMSAIYAVDAWVGSTPVVGLLLPAAMLLYHLLVFCLAGWVTGLIARHSEAAHALAMGVLLLLAGIATFAQVHDELATWWQVVTLICVVPAALLGGALRSFQRLPLER